MDPSELVRVAVCASIAFVVTACATPRGTSSDDRAALPVGVSEGPTTGPPSSEMDAPTTQTTSSDVDASTPRDPDTDAAQRIALEDAHATVIACCPLWRRTNQRLVSWVALDVSANGDVVRARASPGRSSAVSACVAKRARRWTIPVHAARTIRVDLPLDCGPIQL